MPVYTLAQAITATGRSRSTLIRAMRSGKISATRDETGPTWSNLANCTECSRPTVMTRHLTGRWRATACRARRPVKG